MYILLIRYELTNLRGCSCGCGRGVRVGVGNAVVVGETESHVRVLACVGVRVSCGL